MRRNTRWIVTMGSLAVVLIAALVFAVISFAGQNSGLDGTHWNVVQINGQPVPGQTYTFLNTGSISGAFSSLNASPPP